MSRLINKIRASLILVALMLGMHCTAMASTIDFRSRTIGTADGLPSDNVEQVFQDSEGYMWFATRNGLARYDGFGMEIFKSSVRNGDLLTNNSISCLAEDKNHRLWIGTPDGLNYFDKPTGQLHRIDRKEFRNNPISCILPTRDGRIFVGSDQGLYEYFAESDSCYLYTRERSGDVMPQTSVKSLIEDSRGHIWIGTWNENFYRIDPDGQFHAYGALNDRKSAHVIFEDSRHRIWVGTWGRGLYMLRNPYEPAKTTWVNYVHSAEDEASLSDNIIYSISEDPATRTIWVGTRRGVSLLREGGDSFLQIRVPALETPVREVTSIICDRIGMMWISMLGQGALATITRQSGLHLDKLDAIRKTFGTNAVQRVLADSQGRLWLSLGGNVGLVTYNPADRSITTNPHFPFSAAAMTPYTVQSLLECHDGRIFVGTYDGGLYIMSRDGEMLSHHQKADTPWVSGDRVSDIFEDRGGRIWLGGIPGLSVLMPDGSYCRLDSIIPSQVMVNCITEGADGAIWIGTQNMGVLRIDGSGSDRRGYSIAHYNPEKGTLNSSMVTALYCDAYGRIWVGTDGSGLSLYNYKSDLFVPVHMKWNLPGDVVSSILGDSSANLWIGSNMGLYSLKVSPDTTHVNFRVYTSRDGAQDNVFNRNSASMDKDGRMYFGGPHGLNILAGPLDEINHRALPVTITNVEVFGVAWDKLASSQREAVSKLAPGYTDHITLSPESNNFSIEFAVLDFANHPLQHKYAYRLDGFDSDWQYTDVSRRFAYYNNLPAGTYTFRVKASDDDGRWNDDERTLKVQVLPPAWATWWAKLIYLFIFVSLAYSVYRFSRKRVQRRNALHLRELELAQAEELNKAKLKFFTNITHEWLTPLSIISAVAEEMKGVTPEYREYHRIMTSSVNRLSRLLQQVLEFRKAESGNLHLRVSEGHLPEMVENVVDNIMPVLKAKGISCSFTSEPADFCVWYDPDKIDKILYNLLSNAAKYVVEGCSVVVTLKLEGDHAVLSVRDDGPGIPSSRLPDLFKRFYEGEHRRFNTTGNGIGLSLTKDLVDLHHGNIEVKSGEGEGAEFIVTIPVCRSAYADNEIDTSKPIISSGASDGASVVDRGESEKTVAGESATLLVIEDDADLLKVMAQVLGHEYKVLTASSAEDARELLFNNDINLIISDIMMPGIGGVEFCRWAKGRIESCHIPILLLTANTIEEAEVDAYEAGADGFMPKPFSMNVLQARISNLLRMRRTANRNFREQFVTDVDGFDYSGLDENFLKKSVDCITAHIDDPDYSQTMFVEEMGISRSTLFRKLKSLTGLSYSAFVRNIRLKTACRIMQEKRNIRISELAYAVGFNDPKYFSLCFKKEFGMLPSEYIERFITNDRECAGDPNTIPQS